MRKITIRTIIVLIIFVFLCPDICISMEDRTIKRKSQGRRIALVIGNGAYTRVPLKNPVNDANDMAKALEQCDFDVTRAINATRKQMRNVIRTFGNQIKRGGIGLFFYAGHGIQVNGENFLVPINSEVHSEDEVKDECLMVSSVLRKMQSAANDLNIIILDACRDNPFRSFRSTRSGLAQMDAPSGSILAYATAPGSVAADGRGRNGLYTSKFLKHMMTPGLEIGKLFRKVRRDVITASTSTSHKQVPWESSSLTGDFYFASSGVQIEIPAPASKSYLSVECTVSGAKVFIDDKYIGKTNLSRMEVAAGSYQIKVTKDGYEPYKKSVTCSKGRLKSLYVDLKQSGSLKGKLFVNTFPEQTTIKILNINSKFYQGIDLEEGRYHIEVSSQGYKSKKLWITLSSGEDKDVDISLAKTSKDRFTDPITGMEFVWVKGGCYQMGQTQAEKQYLIRKIGQEEYNKYYADEVPRHEVCIDGFWMGKYEVTNREYRKFMSSHNSKDYKGVNLNGDNQPAVNVSWDDAKAFISWLNQKSDKAFALPTEAQWEYACRAGTSTIRYWGDGEEGSCAYANVGDSTAKGKWPEWTCFDCNDGYAVASPVGRFNPNNVGLYDTLGNVWEWCEDRYDEKAYTKHNRNNPLITIGSGAGRVLRGGSWYAEPRNVRAALRNGSVADDRRSNFGFRLCFPQSGSKQ